MLLRMVLLAGLAMGSGAFADHDKQEAAREPASLRPAQGAAETYQEKQDDELVEKFSVSLQQLLEATNSHPLTTGEVELRTFSGK